MRLVRLGCMAVALLALGPPWAPGRDLAPEQEGGNWDPESYPDRGVEQTLDRSRCRDGVQYDLKDIPFRAELKYVEELREAPGRHRELVRLWMESIDADEHAGDFIRELGLEDGGRVRWAAVSEALVPVLRQELARGEKAMFFMSYVGCAAGEPVLAIEEYSLPEHEDIEEEASSYIT